MVLNHINGGNPYEEPPAFRYDESRNAVNKFAYNKSAPMMAAERVRNIHNQL